MPKGKKQEALDYHSNGRPGKVEVVPTKPYSTQYDLALAYSPGVAEPCKEIDANVEKVYDYTNKGNLVAVISDGTAVLGLGDIGPNASKPVMEGKGLLFKVFADIDVFDIEVDSNSVEHFISTVKAIAPTFGGINLEDIKAPQAFEIEERLKAELNIPVMHDDQHGTAIISAAALLNALELTKRKIGKIKVVISGAGAAAISCAKLYQALGAKPENMYMFDSKGLITTDREGLDKYKKLFAVKSKPLTLDQALKGADVFLGLSKGDIMSPEMLLSMAKNPIVFALANPDPEIPYKLALQTRDDVVMATGRSDHPNQVNNVLGFPYIFRGALDVRATEINEAMKLGAVKAIAELAKEEVPEEVNEAYGTKNLTFGRNSIIPKPLDPRLVTAVSMAVAKAAMESGVAQAPIQDWDEYESLLKDRLGLENKLIRNMTERAKRSKKRVVFGEADSYKVVKAAHIAQQEGVCEPILLGNEQAVLSIIEEYSLDFNEGVSIIDPRSKEQKSLREKFGKALYEDRKRKGMTEYEAIKFMQERAYFGMMMVNEGMADAMLSGIQRSYGEAIKPALKVIGREEGVSKAAGMYIVMTKDGPFFFADTTINLDPTAEEIAEITTMVATTVKRLGITPRCALLTYSNFGSSQGKDAQKMRKAKEILRETNPSLVVDGDIQANFALNNQLLKDIFPFSDLVNKKTNVLIFPNLSSGNIAYKMMDEMTDAEVIGPIVLGLNKSFHVLTMGCSVREIVAMATIATIDAQRRRG